MNSAFKKKIWSKFIKAINDYSMIEDGDRVAIGVSGGKDSLLLLKLFLELKKDLSRNFELVPISLNPGYKEKDLENLKENIKKLGIEIEIFDTDIWKKSFEMDEKNPCFLCSKFRRGILYSKAESLNCNKLCLGHHFDDIIETSMINIFYAGTIKTMLPKVKSTSGNFEVIRPLSYVKEENIINYIKNTDLNPMTCGCKMEEEKSDSKRKEIKNLLKDLEKVNPNIKQNIFSSMKNINLDYVLGYTGGNNG